MTARSFSVNSGVVLLVTARSHVVIEGKPLC